MHRAAYFIRRRGEECSIVKLRPDGREEILEEGLTLVDAETLYFICIGEPGLGGRGSSSGRTAYDGPTAEAACVRVLRHAPALARAGRGFLGIRAQMGPKPVKVG